MLYSPHTFLLYHYTGVGTGLYLASLAIFYVISIRQQHADTQRVLSEIEGYLHGVPIIFTVITAAAGIPLDLYNPVSTTGIGCWVAPYPANCMKDADVACIRGKYADTLIWVFAGLELMLSFGIVVVCMILVWYRARSQLKDIMERQGLEEKQKQFSSSRQLEEQAVVPVDESLERMKSSVRLTSQQAFLYISSFLLTYVGPSVLRTKEPSPAASAFQHNEFFALSLVCQLLYPLQGWINFWIYLRPRTMALRKSYPELGWLGLYYEAIFGEQ